MALLKLLVGLVVQTAILETVDNYDAGTATALQAFLQLVHRLAVKDNQPLAHLIHLMPFQAHLKRKAGAFFQTVIDHASETAQVLGQLHHKAALSVPAGTPDNPHAAFGRVTYRGLPIPGKFIPGYFHVQHLTGAVGSFQFHACILLNFSISVYTRRKPPPVL